MLKFIVKPFYKLMNRLNYSSKFLVMIMLFAIPLGIMATQQIQNSIRNLNETKIQRQGVETLAIAHRFIQQLEEWRDIAALRFLSSDPEVISRYEKSITSTQQQIQELLEMPEFRQDVKSVGLLKKLSLQIEKPIIAPGMEAISVEIIYDNVQVHINEAYDWQRQIANRFNLLAIRDTELYQLINAVLNDGNPLYRALGAARTFGSYYLINRFIDSGGVYVIDKTYSTIEKETNKLDVKLPAFITLLNSVVGSATPEDPPIRRALNLVDLQLIQASELTYSWQDYYTQITDDINTTKVFENALLNLAQNKLASLEKDKQDQLALFITMTGLIIALILLLYAGFYYSVRNTIQQLALAAEAVAAGDLDQIITTNTNDELSVLAYALDNMRAQLKLRQMRLHQLSITDGLTQLKNRKFFDEVMDSETNKASRGNYPVSMILIDIDHFKQVNDTHGHLGGDECLRQVAGILTDSIKRSSDVIARYGGEEFAVVLPDTSIDEALLVAEELRKSVATSPVKFGTESIAITLSCGISSIVPQSKKSVADLIRAADEALYEAKKAGRNRCRINPLEYASVKSISNANA